MATRASGPWLSGKLETKGEGWTVKRNPIVAGTAKRLIELVWGRPKRVVFVATTGRSGTATLAARLRPVEGWAAFHEPHPTMSGIPSACASRGDMRAAAACYRYAKSVYIRWYARSARIYVETNHLFATVFADYVFEDFGDAVSVIVLSRERADVARSIFELGHFPGTPLGDAWYLDPFAAENVVHYPELLQFLPFEHPLFRCLWYCVEVGERVDLLRERFPRWDWIDLSTADLNSAERLRALVARIDPASLPAQLNADCGSALNRKATFKERANLRLSEDKFRRLVEAFDDAEARWRATGASSQRDFYRGC